MWDPTPFDPDPLDPGDSPPLPVWALHAPGVEAEVEAEAPVVAVAPEPAAVTPEPPADVVPPPPVPLTIEIQPPRTVLRRLSQLSAPIRVESGKADLPIPPAASLLPPDVSRMEDALAGLERQITQPRPVDDAAFLLPNLVERIRSARLKATEPPPPPITMPVLESEPAEPALEPVLEPVDELPPPPPFFAEPVPEPPVELPMALAWEAVVPVDSVPEPEPEPIVVPEPIAVAEPVAVPEPAITENRAATRHLESLVAALDAEMAHEQPKEAAPRAAADANAERYVVFQLGDTRYGLPIGQVLEMATVPRTTPLPNVPDFIRGVANLRGEVLAIIDLRTLLALEASADTFRERLLVVRAPAGDAVAGLIVDSVRGLARLGAGSVTQPTMALESRVAGFLEGIASHEDQVLNVLDIRKLFAAPEIAALTAH